MESCRAFGINQPHFVPSFQASLAPLHALSSISNRIFICAGHKSTSGRRLPVHRNPPACPTHFHPAALRLVPLSVSSMYVTIFLYPIALAALQAAAYNIEHAFLVPSVQRRLTSNVHHRPNIEQQVFQRLQRQRCDLHLRIQC